MSDESKDSSAETPEADDALDTGGRLQAWMQEVRTHPFAYAVMAVFLIAGPVVATYLFPQAPTGAAIVGGLAMGIFASLCAVPGQFI